MQVKKQLGELTVELNVGIPVWTWLHLGIGVCPVKALVKVYGANGKPQKVQMIEVGSKTWKFIYKGKKEGYVPSIESLTTDSVTGESKYTYTVANITMPRPLWAGGDPKGIGFRVRVMESPGNYVEFGGHWGDPKPLPAEFKHEGS